MGRRKGRDLVGAPCGRVLELGGLGGDGRVLPHLQADPDRPRGGGGGRGAGEQRPDPRPGQHPRRNARPWWVNVHLSQT